MIDSNSKKLQVYLVYCENGFCCTRSTRARQDQYIFFSQGHAFLHEDSCKICYFNKADINVTKIYDTICLLKMNVL